MLLLTGENVEAKFDKCNKVTFDPVTSHLLAVTHAVDVPCAKGKISTIVSLTRNLVDRSDGREPYIGYLPVLGGDEWVNER